MKKSLSFLLLLLALLLAPLTSQGQQSYQWDALISDLNLFWCNDMGRNGYYDQRPIAAIMGEMAEAIGPEAIIAAGDVHHFNGVASVNDPLWTTNFELIYSHPELMESWYPILGNHEYRGNTQAVLDYSRVSRRWVMPGRYYTRVFSGDSCTVRVVFIDTAPLIDKYRNDSTEYPDACRQSRDEQLKWLDGVLRNAREDWVICIGHHPIYAQTPKADSERTDMQRYLLPVLKRYRNVAFYGCGHIHNFQHIRMPKDDIDYWVNSAASLSRKVEPTTGTQWCSSAAGFTVISAEKRTLTLNAIDKDGQVIHSLVRKK